MENDEENGTIGMQETIGSGTAGTGWKCSEEDEEENSVDLRTLGELNSSMDDERAEDDEETVDFESENNTLSGDTFRDILDDDDDTSVKTQRTVNTKKSERSRKPNTKNTMNKKEQSKQRK